MKDVRQPPLRRTSERNDHAQCPWMWQQRWLNGLVPVREPTWAVFGTAWHIGLQVYYPPGRKRGSVLDACDAFLAALDDQGRKIGVDIEELEEAEIERKESLGKKTVKLIPARELGPEMMRAYAKHYGGDREWEVIHTEQTFQIDVPDPRDKSRVLLVLAGTWDALMWHIPTRTYRVWDHKSAKTIPSWGYLELDNQAGTYPWVAKEVLVHKGILTKKDRIHGILFNYAKKAPPDSRPVNAAGESLNKPKKQDYLEAFSDKGYAISSLRKHTVEHLEAMAKEHSVTVEGEVSAMQPAKRFERYYSPRTPQQIVSQARRVQKQGIVMEMMENGTLPIYKTPNRDCERCALFDMCTLEEQGDDWEFYRDEMFKKRDPYRDHREAMEADGIEIRRDRYEE